MRSHGSRPSSHRSTEGVGPRVLAVLADTDDRPCNRRAVQLHRDLALAGEPVRTLALGPGRSAELAAEVPVMSPSLRSLVARTQLLAESRWADLVVLFGTRTLSWSSSRAVGSHPPVVLVLCDDEGDLGRPPRRAERRGACRAARLVVASEELVPVAAERYGRPPAEVVCIDAVATDHAERWRALLREVASGANAG